MEIVGEGTERARLEQQVVDLGLEQWVHFAGWVNQVETLEYYRQADVFCFPSIREFGGAVVLEAMACGLPCIVANNGGIGEYVTDETGYRIEPLSRAYLTEHLTEAIQTLITNTALRQSMAHQAIERAQEFRWATKAQQMVAIYRSVIQEKAVASQISSAPKAAFAN